MKTAINRHFTETNYPNAFITLKRNRIKIYNYANWRGEVFLNGGDEFELEFDNTTRLVWLAKIKLNGEWVSEAGLVLRPGEHTFLDTPDLFSNDKRRFRFETYEVPEGRAELLRDNGLVEIFFHKKQEAQPYWLKSTPITTWTWTRPDYYWYGTSGSGTRKLNGYGEYTVNSCCFSAQDQSSVQSSEIQMSNMAKPLEETGRVEKGSQSGQDFVNVNENFESWSVLTVSYKIFPLSKKPQTVQEVKEYCSNCGRRSRQNDHFCPNCGRKF